MAETPNAAQLFEIAKQHITASNPKIDPAVVGVEGHPANLICGVNAALAEEVARAVGVVERSLFLDTAKGAALDRLAFDRYALTRLGASPSVGAVQFSRATDDAGAVEVPAGTALRTTDGALEFSTLEPATFGATALGPISARVQSLKAGAGQRAAAGQISRFGAAFAADPSITVTNAQGTAGDADAETDAEFAERARRYFQNAARGTLKAIEYGALQVPGVRFAVATEATVSTGEPARFVTLQIGDRLGESNATLSGLVQAALVEWRPAGMHVALVGGTVRWVDITIALAVSASFDSTAVAASVRAALVALLAGFAPGRTLHHSDLVAAAKAVPGVVDCAVQVPAASLVPDADESLRAEAARIVVVGQ